MGNPALVNAVPPVDDVSCDVISEDAARDDDGLNEDEEYLTTNYGTHKFLYTFVHGWNATVMLVPQIPSIFCQSGII